MSSIDQISSPLSFRHGNVQPILNEVLHALDRLLEADESTVIDLASLPFGPGELEELERLLGEGELAADLDALGQSRIRETACPGVWWLEHRNTAGEIVGRYLEITRVPAILMSQTADIAAGRAILGEQLAAADTPGNGGGR